MDNKTQHLVMKATTTQTELMKMPFHKMDECMRCVITKKMKTFQDLKDYYKKNK